MDIDVFSADELDGVFRVLRTALNPSGTEAVARGRFITIEGGEGSGKTTQVGLLVGALGRAGIAAHGTREPGGSPGAEAIRRLLLEGDVSEAARIA